MKKIGFIILSFLFLNSSVLSYEGLSFYEDGEFVQKSNGPKEFSQNFDEMKKGFISQELTLVQDFLEEMKDTSLCQFEVRYSVDFNPFILPFNGRFRSHDFAILVRGKCEGKEEDFDYIGQEHFYTIEGGYDGAREMSQGLIDNLNSQLSEAFTSYSFSVSINSKVDGEDGNGERESDFVSTDVFLLGR